MGPNVRSIFACIAFSIYHIHKVSYYNFRTCFMLFCTTSHFKKNQASGVCALHKEVVVRDVTPM